MKTIRFALFGWLYAVGLVLQQSGSPALAVTASPEELALSRRWTQAAFGSGATTNAPSLKLLYEDVPDSVTRGKSWRGTPYQIGERTYAHGLAFNSTRQRGRPEPAERE